MEPTQFNEIISRFDAFLASLGALGQQAWPILVRQQQVGATVAMIFQAVGLLIFAVPLVGSVLCFRKAISQIALARVTGYGTDGEFCLGWGFGLGLAALAIMIGLVVNVATALPVMLNPDYFAMKDALKIVTGK